MGVRVGAMVVIVRVRMRMMVVVMRVEASLKGGGAMIDPYI